MQDNQDFRQDIQESHIPTKNSARIGKMMQGLSYLGKIEAGDMHVIILDTKTYKIMARIIQQCSMRGRNLSHYIGSDA